MPMTSAERIADKILLVDASPYIFRAHFALPSSLVDTAGRPVNAVYGFGSFLLKLIVEEQPTHLAVAFDHSLTTSFRNQIYPPYKQQREPPPADLVAQLEDCRLLATAIGAAAFVDERYEADDILATLCERAPAARRVVVSSDKDLAQLVTPEIEWLDYARQRSYGPAEVRARFGVDPERIPDLLGLAGDPVDNIPGVPGIGPKSALQLLACYVDIEAVCRDAGAIGKRNLRAAARLQRLIIEHGELALLSKQLATVVRDVPLMVTVDDLRLRPPRRHLLDPLFARLGFDALHARVLAALVP